MPSTKNPNTVVNPGSGRLPVGSVPASALLFVPGGGGEGLSAHITNPVDAHMATAIGVPAVYPAGVPLLSSAGGPYDGENVADALSQLAALLPVKPDTIGFNNPVANTGIPTWGSLNTPLVGAFSNGSNVVFSKYLIGAGIANFALTGMIFPADRGVLALYQSSSDASFVTGATLLAALTLGSSAIASVPSPNTLFSETTRTTGQPDSTASHSGIDLIDLTYRLPYKTSYAGGVPYSPFTVDFAAYQLATYGIQATYLPLSLGSTGSYFLVHWKETFATSLSAIQPTNLAGALTSANCYSAVPSAGNYDGTNVLNVNRRNVFRDSGSSTLPSVSAFSATLQGSPTSIHLSGLQFYDNASSDLSWNMDIQLTNLFNQSYLTGTVPNADILAGYESANNPVTLVFSDFGGGNILVPYYNIKNLSLSGNYSPTNAPGVGDTAEVVETAITIPSPSSFTPTGGIAVHRVQPRDPFGTPSQYADTSNRYLFNSYTQLADIASVVTDTFDSFVSERYRYATGSSNVDVATSPIIPLGGDLFPSATPLTAGGSDLQVIGGEIVYPKTNFGAAGTLPTGQPDYSAVFSGDGTNQIRRYVRAFNTGVSRSTGKIRLRNLAYSTFTTTVGDTTEVANHPGGAIVQLKVPGLTGWLDLGRAFGSFDGCGVGAPVVSGSDIIVSFNTGSSTGNNGSGKFLLFIRIGLIKGVGDSLVCDEIEWQSP